MHSVHQKAVDVWLGKRVRHVSDNAATGEEKPGVVVGVEFTLDNGFLVRVSWDRTGGTTYYADELTLVSEGENPYA